MRSTIIMGVVYAASITAAAQPLPADARCFKYWYYNYPQNCGGVYFRTHHDSAVVVRTVNAAVPPVSDIPLPDMSANWGGAMDTELELEMQRQRAIKQLAE